MPHQCVRCSKIYEDASAEILKGCNSCGGRFFFFVKKEALQQVQEAASQLTKADKDKIEKDVMEIIGYEDSTGSSGIDALTVQFNVLTGGMLSQMYYDSGGIRDSGYGITSDLNGNIIITGDHGYFDDTHYDLFVHKYCIGGNPQP